MNAPRLESAAQTEPGPRPVNEDSLVSRQLPDGRWFAAVADGMGGLEAGEVASRTAIDVMLREVGSGSDLVSAVETAHRAILHEANGRAMGTTIVAALVDHRGLSIVNVGDSRAYLFGAAGLVQVTMDHTVAAEAVARGDPGVQKGVADSRWGQALTRSLGSRDPLRVDRFGPFRIEDGLRLLLCSDGVHRVLTHEVIETLLRDQPDVHATVRHLVKASLDHGSQDNVSAVLLRLGVPEAGTSPDTSADLPGIGRAAEPSDWGEAKAPERSESERLLPLAAAEDASAGPADWDLAALVGRSHNPMRRKPGRLNAALLVVGLFLAIATVIVLLRTMTS